MHHLSHTKKQELRRAIDPSVEDGPLPGEDERFMASCVLYLLGGTFEQTTENASRHEVHGLPWTTAPEHKVLVSVYTPAYLAAWAVDGIYPLSAEQLRRLEAVLDFLQKTCPAQLCQTHVQNVEFYVRNHPRVETAS